MNCKSPNTTKNSQFDNYKNFFIQRWPRYAIKHLGGKRWCTKNKPLCDKPILAHLEGKYFVGILANGILILLFWMLMNSRQKKFTKLGNR